MVSAKYKDGWYFATKCYAGLQTPLEGAEAGRHPEKESRMDQAVSYIQNRKDTLILMLEDERCNLSNISSETSIRPLINRRRTCN